MTKTLKAKDTFHSSVHGGLVKAGETFDSSEPAAKELIDAGLATEVAGKAPKAAEAKASAPAPVTPTPAPGVNTAPLTLKPAKHKA